MHNVNMLVNFQLVFTLLYHLDVCPLVAIDGLTVQTSSSYVASSTPFNITISVVDGTPELFVISISEQGDPVDEIIVERSNLCETFRPTQIEIVLQERGTLQF